jgi:hypothetical protein
MQMPIALSKHRAQGLGALFLATMLGLLIWNGVTLVRNQRDFPDDYRIEVHPRSIGQALMSNSMELVRLQFGTYQQLRLLRGKTLVVPADGPLDHFMLEHASRVRLEISPEHLLLPAATTERLQTGSVRFLQADGATALQVVVAPGASRYVAAEREGGGLILIVPEDVYRRERAAQVVP